MLSKKELYSFISLNIFYTLATLIYFYTIDRNARTGLLPIALSFTVLFSTFSLITLVINSFRTYKFGAFFSVLVSFFFLIPVVQAFYYFTYGQGIDIQILSVLIREPRFVLSTLSSELTIFKSIIFVGLLSTFSLIHYYFFGNSPTEKRSPHFYFHNKYVLIALFILVGTQIKWALDHDPSQLTIRPLYPLLGISLFSSFHYVLSSQTSKLQKTFILAIPISFLSLMYFINIGSIELKKNLNLGSQAYTSLFGAYFVQGALGDMKQNSGLEGKVPNAQPQFNILLIVNDSQRWDILDINGFDKPTTRALSWYLKDAYNFSFPIAPANFTDTSLPGIFYGLGSDKDLLQIKDSLTVWDFFSKNAETFYYSDSDIGWSKLDLMIKSVGQKDVWSLPLSSDVKNVDKTEYTRFAAQKVIDKIQSLKDKSWFGVWNTDISHYPYILPKEEEIHTPCDSTRESGMDSFKNCYINSNYYSFKLYDKVLRNIDIENTVVIMTSDHGEGMNEHGFMLHGKGYYQEIVKVPLIIHLPKRIRESVPAENLKNLMENTKKITSLLDITPTLIHLHQILTGEKQSDLKDLSGLSLLNPIPNDRVVFSSHCYPQYRCYSREILLVNNDFYGIFEPTKGFTAIYDTWNDLKQEHPLNPEVLYQKKDPQFLKYLKDAANAHPLARSIGTFFPVD